MELQELYSLMERFASSGLTELEWEQGEEKVRLRREPAPVVRAENPAPAAVPAPAPAPVPEKRAEGDLVKAPLVGVFYAAPAPGEAPFAAPGKQVKKGETLCLLEAMKMMSEVPAPCDCVIEEVLVQDGELAGFDTPLFRVREL